MKPSADSREPPGTDGPPPWRRLLAEFSGGCGDLGTLLPYTVGAIAVAGLAPAGVLLGFGTFFVASGLFYGLPMAVQPMKAISAVLVTGQVGAAEIAAAGVLLGATLLVLAATGTIGWLARAIPQSVSAGLQLGLGISMALLGLELMRQTPWLSALSLAALVGLMLLPRFPAALAMLAGAIAAGLLTGLVQMPHDIGPAWPALTLATPAPAEIWRAVELLVIPQLPLTLTNAVIVTALVSRDLFPAAGARASERNLALTSGAANLLLAPLGAIPMCHGAGGVQAQHLGAADPPGRIRHPAHPHGRQRIALHPAHAAVDLGIAVVDCRIVECVAVGELVRRADQFGERIDRIREIGLQPVVLGDA